MLIHKAVEPDHRERNVIGASAFSVCSSNGKGSAPMSAVYGGLLTLTQEDGGKLFVVQVMSSESPRLSGSVPPRWSRLIFATHQGALLYDLAITPDLSLRQRLP